MQINDNAIIRGFGCEKALIKGKPKNKEQYSRSEQLK